MKANGSKLQIYDKDLEGTYGLMDLYTMVGGRITKLMEKED